MTQTHAATNSAGTRLGPRGYVRCQTCDKETDEISRETSPQYAYCLTHRPKKEGVMPAVPKPSQKENQASENSDAKGKAPKTAKVKASAKSKKADAPKRAIPRNGSHQPKIPQKGNMATFLAAIKEAGGMTKTEIQWKAATYGLGGKSWMHAAYYSGKLGLLKND